MSDQKVEKDILTPILIMGFLIGLFWFRNGQNSGYREPFMYSSVDGRCSEEQNGGEMVPLKSDQKVEKETWSHYLGKKYFTFVLPMHIT